MLRHVSPSYFTSTIYVYELLFNVTQYHIFTLLPEICTEGRGGQIDQPTPPPTPPPSAPFPIRQKKKKKPSLTYLRLISFSEAFVSIVVLIIYM